MLKKISILLISYMLVLGLISIHASAEVDSSTIQRLDQSVKKIVYEKMPNAEVSIAIRDDFGNVIYDFNGNRQQKPASNMKLLTSAAALTELGENYRFRTNIYTTGYVKKGTLHGDLYLQGTGDPTLTVDDLDQFASFLADQGIKKIDGRIIGDDFWFDQDLLTPDIKKDDESYYYAAPITALTLSPDSDYDSGTVIIEALGEIIGEKPRLKTTPELGELVIKNEAKTVATNQNTTLKIEREYRKNKVVVSGNLPIHKSWKEWITVPNPTLHTVLLFIHALEKHNVQYTQEQLFRGKTPTSATLMVQKQSIPLAQIIIPYMKLSNNSIADILVKTMGKVRVDQGSTKAGLRVVKQYALSRHLNMDDWFFEDGSGMSHNNSVSSIDLTKLLYSVQKEKQWYSTFFNSLPVAANSDRMIGGSLKNRLKSPFTEGRVFAKTGAIDGVNTLSGYLIGNSGMPYSFSILVQNQNGTIPAIDEIVEKMAEEL
ncbi:D-alanyl-D-alanine carboxypeptidase/D-alanyl-D-alanine endopeptidase [Rummeliibacillus pycnus]|uniref:D-alanyl-D-alanine carboxypeptidase/D-alanyl-D-alanine endopeptidase n=1 Tax=Rummeliibacillus pycnus TaxID=101070 RepID=UPI000C9BC7B8|nr:D-alanyl-D-alanine carboxypeptidase/D-alanyl-D-alanine-endopeptidase [Rummeliibacillus pycnus]